jgi:hypothetical protein
MYSQKLYKHGPENNIVLTGEMRVGLPADLVVTFAIPPSCWKAAWLVIRFSDGANDGSGTSPVVQLQSEADVTKYLSN